MVTRLTFRKTDPNGLGRGEGYYYLRGGKRPDSKNHTYKMPDGTIKTIKGPYYSKYSKETVKKTLSTGWRNNKIGIPNKLANVYGHVTDGELKKRIRR